MRIKTEVAGLDARQWAYLNRALLTEYEFTGDQTRVCATFTNGVEERHIEMPLATYTGVLVGLSVTGVVDAVQTAMQTIRQQPPFIAPGDQARPL